VQDKGLFLLYTFDIPSLVVRLVTCLLKAGIIGLVEGCLGGEGRSSVLEVIKY